MKTSHLLWALVISAVLLGGCGGGEKEAEADLPTRLPRASVTLDGRVGPANAGIRIAEERGYFEDLGLDVWSGSPVGPSRPVSYVAGKNNEFGVTQLPQLVMARERGMPLVAVGSLMPRPTAAMIWLKRSQIGGLDDLAGKTIAIPGLPFQEAFLEAALKRVGLTLEDVDIKRVGYKLVSVLLGGRADAIFGGSWNIEGAALQARGAEPVIKRVEDLGVPSYDELVVIARPDFVAEDPQLIRDVLSAVRRGIATAQENPRAAVELIEESSESSPESSPKETEAGVKATLPLLSTRGYMDPRQAEDLVDWMYEEGLVRRRLPVAELLTNEYVESP